MLASLIIPDLCLILPAYIDPYVPLFKYLLLPPVIFLNLWAVWIFLFPYRNQLQVYLYMGIYGLLVSAGLVVATNKIVYYSMGLQSLYYPIISITGYLLFIVLWARLHLKALYSGFYYKAENKPRKANRQAAAISLFTGAGVIIGHVIIAKITEYNQTLSVLSGIFWILAIIMILLTHNLHKYYLILKNPELVRDKMYNKPKKKEKKQ